METLLHRVFAGTQAGTDLGNPDCDLKTRGWEAVTPTLRQMVEAARRLRASIAVPGQ
jgi:5-methyltetrahydropteroyltriglutamate--homocysteine methyltransferase